MSEIAGFRCVLQVMIKVIINADDLGKSHTVNMAIAEALGNKHITSSTILANTAYWDEVHKIVEENPWASFGVHLNLTEGKALTDSPVLRNSGIVDKNNCFTKAIREVWPYSNEVLDAVFAEWDAQIAKVKTVEGIPVTHFDGHHHIHSIIEFEDVLCRLGEKYDIHRLRNRYYYPRGGAYDSIRFIARIPVLRELFCRGKGVGKLGSILQREAENTVWQKKVKKVYRCPDCFNAYENQVKLLNNGVLLPDNSVIELMCHPGHSDFEEEYLLIKEKTIEKRIKSQVSYINYSVL